MWLVRLTVLGWDIPLNSSSFLGNGKKCGHEGWKIDLEWIFQHWNELEVWCPWQSYSAEQELSGDEKSDWEFSR